MPAEHRTIAQELFEEHRLRRPFRPLRDKGTLEDAYDIQEKLQELFVAGGYGDIVGYKIALTSPAMQAFVGLDHPLAGAIFASRVHGSPQEFDLTEFQHLGIECEIAVRLATDIPSRPQGHTPESVAPAIGAVMPAFEMIEDRNADYKRIDAFSVVADNSWNAGNVLGSPVTDWQSLNLLTIRGVLQVNGETVGEGKGADALGNPLAAVAWLADQLAAQGRSLKRGMIVMTGSIVKTYFPKPGDQLDFTVEGLGNTVLRLANA